MIVKLNFNLGCSKYFDLEPSSQGIIEGDQIQVTAFSLEYFAYLIGLPWANENASIKSAKAGRLIKNEQHYWACVLIGPG